MRVHFWSSHVAYRIFITCKLVQISANNWLSTTKHTAIGSTMSRSTSRCSTHHSTVRSALTDPAILASCSVNRPATRSAFIWALIAKMTAVKRSATGPAWYAPPVNWAAMWMTLTKQHIIHTLIYSFKYSLWQFNIRAKQTNISALLWQSYFTLCAQSHHRNHTCHGTNILWTTQEWPQTRWQPTWMSRCH